MLCNPLLSLSAFSLCLPVFSLSEYFQAADLFILPSKKYETFGLITLEAISSGCPTFGYIACANSEIIKKGAQTFLAPPSNDALASKINRFLKYSESKQKKFFEEEKKNLPNFTWEKTTNKLIELIESI